MSSDQTDWLLQMARLRQQGHTEEALQQCNVVLQQEPHNTEALGYRAMLLGELERLDESLLAYEKLAFTFAQQGDYLQALTTAKDLSSIDAQRSASLTGQIAQQYEAHLQLSEPSEKIPTQDFPPFLVEATLPSLPSFRPGLNTVSDEDEMLQRLIHLQEVGDTEDIEPFQDKAPVISGNPAALPPLFHQLDAESTAAIWSSMQSMSYEADQLVIKQGEEGNSFFIITEGTVCVSHVVEGESEELGYLGAGQFFGEIALMTPLRRTANVKTVSPCKFLRLERGALESIVMRHPNVHQELKRFVYQRLIHNLLISSLLFFPLSDIKRWELAQKFTVVEVPPGYDIITEDTLADGLYLVAGGYVELLRQESDGTLMLINSLGPGQFFGELSILTKSPSPCTVQTSEPTTFLKLHAADFYSVLEQYPRVFDLLQAVATQRSRELALLEQSRELPYAPVSSSSLS
jgi:CRP-like cAMP-binding protein